LGVGWSSGVDSSGGGAGLCDSSLDGGSGGGGNGALSQFVFGNMLDCVNDDFNHSFQVVDGVGESLFLAVILLFVPNTTMVYIKTFIYTYSPKRLVITDTVSALEGMMKKFFQASLSLRLEN